MIRTHGMTSVVPLQYVDAGPYESTDANTHSQRSDGLGSCWREHTPEGREGSCQAPQQAIDGVDEEILDSRKQRLNFSQQLLCMTRPLHGQDNSTGASQCARHAVASILSSIAPLSTSRGIVSFHDSNQRTHRHQLQLQASQAQESSVANLR